MSSNKHKPGTYCSTGLPHPVVTISGEEYKKRLKKELKESLQSYPDEDFVDIDTQIDINIEHHKASYEEYDLDIVFTRNMDSKGKVWVYPEDMLEEISAEEAAMRALVNA